MKPKLFAVAVAFAIATPLAAQKVISATDLLLVTIICLGVLGFATDKVFQLLARVAFGRFT